MAKSFEASAFRPEANQSEQVGLSQFVQSITMNEHRSGSSLKTAESDQLSFGTHFDLYGSEDATTKILAFQMPESKVPYDVIAQGEDLTPCDLYENHDGLFDLLELTTPSYLAAKSSFSEALQKDENFMANLLSLPELVYSGQTNEVLRVKLALLARAGEGNDSSQTLAALERYFSSIDLIASDNRELVDELSNLFKTCPAVAGRDIPIT